MLRVVAPHALHPPERMVPARLGILAGLAQQLILLAQVAAQAGIDEAGQPRRQLELRQRLTDWSTTVWAA